jgi:hypothetical protein
MTGSKSFFLLLIFLLLFALSTCGIEEYFYLPKVPESGITQIDNSFATVSLPPISAADFSYAIKYTIFYRIYLSESINTGLINTPEQRKDVNAQLDTDFNFFSTYTNNTNASFPSNSTFINRNYYEIEIEGYVMSDVLQLPSAASRVLTINFSPLEPASIIVTPTGSDYIVRRCTTNSSFAPKPDLNRRFLFSDDLRSYGYASTNTGTSNVNLNNRDVFGASTESQGLAASIFVSMYVVAVGYNSVTTFQDFYGKPTHIGIFKLE